MNEDDAINWTLLELICVEKLINWEPSCAYSVLNVFVESCITNNSLDWMWKPSTDWLVACKIYLQVLLLDVLKLSITFTFSWKMKEIDP